MSGGVGEGEERWVPTHPTAPACLSTVSEIMCCGYTGVTALRPDVGEGLRTYVRADELSLLFALSPRRSIFLSLVSPFGQHGSAHCIFARVYTFINRLTYRATTTTTTTTSPREPAPD